MATFKCNISGNTVEFVADHDVKAMREHPGYTEVTVPVKEEKKEVKSKKSFFNKED